MRSVDTRQKRKRVGCVHTRESIAIVISLLWFPLVGIGRCEARVGNGPARMVIAVTDEVQRLESDPDIVQ